jgi:5-methylcytosine-specific restriction enzyme A
MGYLFSLTDTAFIDIILSNPEFKKKNVKGHRMYSVALNHFKRYIEYYNDSELQAELMIEEQEFEKYLTENPDNISVVNIVDKPIDKPKYRSVNNKKVWARNPKFASEAVAKENFLCEYDNNHKHFISKFNQRNYIEAHHLIPLQYQEQFDSSLDIHANIVSICLACHKKIHFGIFKDKKEILEKLFNSRRERLSSSGIIVSLDEFFSYYRE